MLTPFLRSVLTSTLDGSKWSASRSGPLYRRGKSSRYPLNIMLREAHNRCGRFIEKNVLLLSRLEPRSVEHPTRSPVTISTELSWFPVYCSPNGTRLQCSALRDSRSALHIVTGDDGSVAGASVCILTGIPTILTSIFRGLPQFVQPNAQNVLSIMSRP